MKQNNQSVRSDWKQYIEWIELIDLAQWEIKQGHNIEACETCQFFLNSIRNLIKNFDPHIAKRRNKNAK